MIASLLFGNNGVKDRPIVVTSANPSARLGELTDKNNIGEQLHDLKGKVERTMTKSKTELKKFRELSKFNETITKSYVANLKVIVDVSKLLKGYNEFFDVVRQRIGEIDQELGLPISSNDFDYMQQLTSEQMRQLTDVFTRETDNLRNMYARHGRQKEYEEIVQAEKLFNDTTALGVAAAKTLKPPAPLPDLFGGAKISKKKLKTKTKDNKK
jgi:hypothetical protein